MTDVPSNIPGVFSLFLTTFPTETVNISVKIPRQVITLVGVRAQFASAADALTARLLYVDIGGLFTYQSLVDNNPSYTLLPIKLDNAIVTMSDGLDLPVYLSKMVPERFNVTVYNAAFGTPANLTNLYLEFKTSHGVIT